MMAPYYRGNFARQPGNVLIARKSVARFARECGFPDEKIADIELAASEALNNAFEHGCLGRFSGFSVFCDCVDGELAVEVRDSGTGFRVTAESRMVEPEKHRRGFGIYLMRRLMDDVSFARNGSTVRLLCRRHPV
jgi:anti-sigma regulatory factor (Ser/Thr protein kinase)